MKSLTVFVFFVFTLNTAKASEIKWTFYFESNTFELVDLEQKRLAKFVTIINKFNIDSLQILGFADEDGGNNSNLVLSKKRTDNIKAHLGLNDSVFVKLNWFGEDFNGYIKDSTLKFKNRKVEVVAWCSGKKYPPVYFNGMRLKKGDNLNLPAVRFVPGKSIMLPGGEQKLDEIAEILIKNPTVKFLVEGHVCCQHEVELSENRAKAVYFYLIEKGVDKRRLKYFGYGISKLAYERNDGRNRRVELKVLDV